MCKNLDNKKKGFIFALSKSEKQIFNLIKTITRGCSSTKLKFMKTIKLTYDVIAIKNPYSQKTITATVSNNSSAFAEFEEAVKKEFEDDKCKIYFNHAGKVVTLDYSFKS